MWATRCSDCPWKLSLSAQFTMNVTCLLPVCEWRGAEDRRCGQRFPEFWCDVAKPACGGAMEVAWLEPIGGKVAPSLSPLELWL